MWPTFITLVGKDVETMPPDAVSVHADARGLDPLFAAIAASGDAFALALAKQGT